MLRPTSGRAPHDPIVRAKSALPFGMLVSPLAGSPTPRLTPPADSTLSDAAREAHAAASAVGAHDIPRCALCGAYISTKCSMNARYWRCALCAAKNDLPARYASTVLANDHEAIELIPELSRDVYDVPVFEPPYTGEEYTPPTAYIFLLDQGGDDSYLNAARMAIKSALDVVEGDSLVGVILYDEYLSFVDAREDKGVLRRISAVDTDISIADIFPPDQWLRQSSPAVSKCIMDTINTIAPIADPYNPDHSVKRALGPAVRAALDMIEVAELLASRIIVLAAGEPNYGDGQIIITDETITSRDKFPKPSSTFYADQGIRASILGSMIDLYLISCMPLDVASISPLAQTSGGRLAAYEHAESTLSQDLWQHLNDPAVVRGLLRIRTSPEFTVAELYGSGVYRDAEVHDVFRLGCHGHTSTLAIDFEFTSEEGFSERSGHAPCVQIAFRGVFLEPGKFPRRMLRIETYCYSVTSSRSVVRSEADANAIATVLFHKAVAAADEHGIGEARMLLFDWLANLLANIVEVADDGTQILDSSMQNHPSIKTLPRLIFGLIRSFLFRQEAVAPDTRAAVRCIWEDLNPELLAAAAYPRLFSFLNLEEKSIKELPLSSLAVKQSGHPVFMLDAFSEVVIYYAAPNRRDLVFPPPESSTIMRVRAACIRDRPVTPKCIICREGTSKDRWFKSFLIEDALPGAAAQSFTSFMQGVTDAAEELLNESSE